MTRGLGAGQPPQIVMVCNAPHLYGHEARVGVLVDSNLLDGRIGAPLDGDYSPQEALSHRLDGTGLRVDFTSRDAAVVVMSASPATSTASVSTPASELKLPLAINAADNLNVAALHVANVDNIQVQGKSTGIPVVTAVNNGALTAASSAASAASQMAQDIVRKNASGVQQRHWIITVQVEGFGDSSNDDDGKKRKHGASDYHALSPVAVVGFGGVGRTQRAYLTDEERQQLGLHPASNQDR